jgi:hypothetical protein
MAQRSFLTRITARLWHSHIDWVAAGNQAAADADARAVASRFSRGNVPIQQSAFLMGSDLEEERQKVSNLKFPRVA